MRADSLPIEGYRGHPILEDCDIYRSGGESGALVYLCDSGHTYYLATDDLALLQHLAQSAQPGGDEDRLIDLCKMGFVRKHARPELGPDLDEEDLDDPDMDERDVDGDEEAE